MDVNVRSLPIYEKVFDVEYPLPKLDVLVVCRLDPTIVPNSVATRRRMTLMLEQWRTGSDLIFLFQGDVLLTW